MFLPFPACAPSGNGVHRESILQDGGNTHKHGNVGSRALEFKAETHDSSTAQQDEDVLGITISATFSQVVPPDYMSMC